MWFKMSFLMTISSLIFKLFYLIAAPSGTIIV